MNLAWCLKQKKKGPLKGVLEILGKVTGPKAMSYNYRTYIYYIHTTPPIIQVHVGTPMLGKPFSSPSD